MTAPAATAAVLFGLMLAPACASSQVWHRPVPGVALVDERAYAHGYEDGLRRGAFDLRRGRSYDYARHGDYRDANDGYRGGDRVFYRNLYRQGFVAGYRDGYRGDPRSGFQAAMEVGFRDGYEQGHRDARRGRRFDPVRASRYRSGDRGYHYDYGSRDQYKRAYRAAFQQGYAYGYGGR